MQIKSLLCCRLHHDPRWSRYLFQSCLSSNHFASFQWDVQDLHLRVTRYEHAAFSSANVPGISNRSPWSQTTHLGFIRTKRSIGPSRTQVTRMGIEPTNFGMKARDFCQQKLPRRTQVVTPGIEPGFRAFQARTVTRPAPDNHEKSPVFVTPGFEIYSLCIAKCQQRNSCPGRDVFRISRPFACME